MKWIAWLRMRLAGRPEEEPEHPPHSPEALSRARGAIQQYGTLGLLIAMDELDGDEPAANQLLEEFLREREALLHASPGREERHPETTGGPPTRLPNPHQPTD
ncbi:MAG: hypothetical protein HY520_03200 [Candidatus Aenigmarchaeota archaeon]|nr:hypothetical protein [Candidatus Aenigmarchaeota archaeon]